jgi:hypothetical protein
VKNDVLGVVLSLALFAAQWIYFALDRPRVLERRPERAGRVDATGIWALRSLVFGPLALPFYLGRTRGWRGAVVGVLVGAGLIALSSFIAP